MFGDFKLIKRFAMHTDVYEIRASTCTINNLLTM